MIQFLFSKVSKQTNELMAKAFHNLYGLHNTGLRFFTVYGPYGRPDMAMYIFAKNIMEGRPIIVYNNGKMQEILLMDDIIIGIISSIEKNYNNEIFNLGNNKMKTSWT